MRMVMGPHHLSVAVFHHQGVAVTGNRIIKPEAIQHGTASSLASTCILSPRIRPKKRQKANSNDDATLVPLTHHRCPQRLPSTHPRAERTASLRRRSSTVPSQYSPASTPTQMNSAQPNQAEGEPQPMMSTEIPSSPSVNDAEIDSHRQIESDVQQLLSEMQTSFKSFSDNVFTQIDQMEAKISELDATLASFSKSVQASSDHRASVSVSPNLSPSKRTGV